MIDEQTDHDLLICIDAKLKELKKAFDNHLEHHFRYSFYAFTVCVGLIITLIVLLLKLS